MVLNSALAAMSGLAALWFLTRMLTKEMFGAYSVAMSAVFLAAILATMGLERAMLLRIAGLGGPPGVLRGTGLLVRAGVAVAVMACLIAALLTAGAGPLVQAGAMTDLALWLPALAVAVVPLALTGLAQGWFQANHQAPAAVILPGLSDIARAGFIGLAYALAGGVAGVKLAVVAGSMLPLAVAAVWAMRAPRRRAPRRLLRGDFRNGAFFMLQNLTVTGMRYVDLLVLGLLASGSVTADYAVAARLAAATDLGRSALKPTFTPRVRRHLRNGDPGRLAREYHALRLGGLAFSLLAAAAFAAAGKPLLGLFGPFESAYGPLLLLVAVHVMSAGTGMHSSYLSMSGEVVWSAAIRMGSLVALVLLILALAPAYGALGAAFAMFAVQAGVNLLSVLLLWRIRRFVAVPLIPAVLLTAAVVLLVAGAMGGVAPPLVGAGLMVLAAMSVLAERSARRDLIQLFRKSKDTPP
jgi:O-antigen/teichoic acid export membrane protein